MRKKDARIEALRKVPLLSSLSRRDLIRVLALSEEQEYLPGKVIVKTGNRARDFYLMLSGMAQLSVPRGKTAVLGPGDYFGEMAVLDGEPRSATIVARTHVVALRIGRAGFVKLLNGHGSIGLKILVEMSRRLRAAESDAVRH